jgi:alanyl-tRNA synthetase
MTSNEIRSRFLDFFKSRGHEIVPSDSLVPKDDPTLLFTGAGMNQFKEKFLGRNITYRRAASSQKCLRTADLENVGRTSGHHTFFEMLGNFSFGDYFKKDAILWAWEFLVQGSGLKAQDLWASVYKDDEEAYAIWRDVVKIPEAKVIKFGAKENFWPSEAPTKGPNGPCGPCSEIFYDWGKDVGCGKEGCTPACDCGRFIEVWNLVFTQFDRQPDGSLKPLPNKNIDTGMGLERLASVMQGVKTNFEIDIFKPIVNAILTENRGQKTEDRARVNAIADHVRAVTFAIADGVMPSNEQRGYVIRKLIRRARTHAEAIGISRPILYKLVGIVAGVMKEPYPEIVERRDDIAQVVRREEENFSLMLTTVLPKVEEAFKDFSARKDGDGRRLVELAFNFYDTYGAPYDLLEECAQKFKLDIDKDAFEKLLDAQRETSRAKTKIKTEIFSETFAKKVEALGLETEFLGYEKAHATSKVLAVLEGGEVVLDKTPFYGESGGQAGDWGIIETKSGTMKVEDAKKIGRTIVHIGDLVRGRIEKGEVAKVSIDEDVRKNVMRNHTATHLLHAALRKVLGEHVHQTGSLVDAKHLRFDFTHTKKLSPRELERVEEIVNENIKKAMPVNKKVMDIESAKQEGAMALFGEKYDRMVRVVSVGDVSKELCGGTHVDSTAEIGLLKITAESSIAAGTRRIEALTGAAAMDFMTSELSRLAADYAARKDKAAKACGALKGIEAIEAPIQTILDKKISSPLAIDAYRKYRAGLLEAVEALDKLSTKISKEKERDLVAEKSRDVDEMISRGKAIGAVYVIAEEVKGANQNALRAITDNIRTRRSSTVVVLGACEAGRVALVAAVTKDLADKGVRADGIIKEIAPLVGGSGGGRPDFAQAGGKDPSRLGEALEKVFEIVTKGSAR